MSDKCDQEVWELGTSLGFRDMSKEEAEQYCKDQTEKTGYKHDWHYVGGRVHIKALIPTRLTRALEQVSELQQEVVELRAHVERLRNYMHDIAVSYMAHGHTGGTEIMVEWLPSLLDETPAQSLHAHDLEVAEMVMDCIITRVRLGEDINDVFRNLDLSEVIKDA